jgi:hypothetical protein
MMLLIAPSFGLRSLSCYLRWASVLFRSFFALKIIQLMYKVRKEYSRNIAPALEIARPISKV